MKRFLLLFLLFLAALGVSSTQADEVTRFYKALGVKYQRSLEASPIMGYYTPQADKIYLLKKGQYFSRGDFNHVALHELGHWARHRRRLGPVGARVNTPIYVEEIVVDLSAQILTEEMGMEGQTDAVVVRYLDSQLRGEKLTVRDWKIIHREVHKTAEFLLRRPLEKETVDTLFIRLGLPA